MESIINVKAREILDSRGDPAVEVEIETETHIKTISSVPSGASVGSHEVIEIRDKDPQRYNGMGVLKAIENVEKIIAPAITGQDVTAQKQIDEIMNQLDGTPHKSKLGGNAILPVSVAVCKAGAILRKISLFKYIQGLTGIEKVAIPKPMMNFIEGGKHADNNIEIQEFLVIPEGEKFSDQYRDGSEMFHNLKKMAINRGLGSVIGHEGGFAPNLPSDEDALKMLSELGRDKIALDLAGAVPNGITLDDIVSKYNIASLEDPVEEDDLEMWVEVTKKFGQKIMIVGDDVFTTDIVRLKEGFAKGIANAVIVKPNQIGTVTEAIEFANLARSHNYKIVASHRSGETEDTFIADFAVGIGADYAKFGAPSRGERICKYNRLLRIEEELGI